MTQRERAETVAKMVLRATQTYREPGERAALRCALGDAAALCDRLSNDIGVDNHVRGGRISKRGLELAAVINQCANEIWAMREKIIVHADGEATIPKEPK